MKLHLPVRLFKSVLACLAAVASFSLGSGVAWAEAQNLTFSGSSLTWDTSTENKYFVDEEDAAASFAAGDNVSFTGESTVTLGEDISAGTVAIEKGADVTIDLDVFELNVDRIELSGLLDMGYSLNIGAGTTLAMNGAGAVLDSNLILGEEGVLSVTGAGGSLNGHSLTLQEGASLILTGAVLSRETTDVDQDGELFLIVTPTGDGKTYTLLTGVDVLVNKTGNALAAGSYAIDDLFDFSQPGSGFWTGGALVYASDGTLTLVRHNETVKDALEVTTRQIDIADYQYYKGLTFSSLVYSSSSAEGGAIYGASITLSNNGNVVFEGNTASATTRYSDAHGGAISGGSDNSMITLSYNGSVVFIRNTASASGSYSIVDNYGAYGGAIYGGNLYRGNGSITLSNNGSVVFCENMASSSGRGLPAYGGVIYGDNNITLSNNGSVTFHENSATSSNSVARAGAIACFDTLAMDNNGSVDFIGNKASSSGNCVQGGAIYGDNKITMNNNDIVTFIDNVANSYTYYAEGGAIYCFGAITMNNNGCVIFNGNTAFGLSYAYGGAIRGEANNITLSHNGSVAFIGNKTFSSGSFVHGGAMSGPTITLSHNDSVTFIGNSASSSSSSAYSGAISAGRMNICYNGETLFWGNHASAVSGTARGGVIESSGGVFCIQNNASVVFGNNYILESNTLRLQSIWLSDSVGVVVLVDFSAPQDARIEFRDSIYINVDNHSDSAFHLNNRYENDAGAKVAQTGDIIFTGADATAENLKAILGAHGINREATVDEIRLSKTSEVGGTMQLHDGRLIVRDGAVIEADGITVHGSASGESTPTLWLDNGELSSYLNSSVRKNAISISGGSALRLSGQNTAMYSTLTLSPGSTLIIDVAATHTATAALTLDNGTLTLGGGITLQLNAAEGLAADGRYMLLSGVSEPTDWASHITVSGGVWSIDDLSWVNNTLYLNYPTLTEATWNNASRDWVWNIDSSVNWEQHELNWAYRNGIGVIFGDEACGTVKLAGNLAPKSVLVNNSIGKDYVFSGTGSLTDSMKLTKEGTGKLTIQTSNSYTGGTEIKGGVLVVDNPKALGTGEVVLNDGTLEIAVTGLANTLANTGTSTLKVSYGKTHSLAGTIDNSGELTLEGLFDATALATAIDETHIDANGQEGNSGFLKTAGMEVDIMTGSGTLVNNGTVSISGTMVTLDSTGYGKTGAELQLGTYTIVDGTHSVEAILDKSATANIILEAGTLEVDASTDKLTATGGSIEMTEAATLGGSIENTAVSTSAGSYSAEISAMLKGDTSLEINGGNITVSGDNSHTGGTTLNNGTVVAETATAMGAVAGAVVLNGGTLEIGATGLANSISNTGTSTLRTSAGITHVLTGTISNSGTLTMSGSFDASGMTSTLTNVDMRVDENGAVSRDSSGFLRTGDFEVLVATGTVDSTNAEVTYGGQTLTMTGGTGFGVGEVKYDTYLLQGDDTATVSKIATMAGAALQKIDMQGGTLNVNASTDELVATGGSIQLSAGTLGGSIGGTAAVAVNGTATISGNNSYTGGTALSNGNLTITHANALGTGSISAEGTSSLIVGSGATLALESVISNSGTLALSGSFDASALAKSESDDIYVALNGTEDKNGSGFLRSGDFSVLVVNGGTVDSTAATITWNGTSLEMTGGTGFAAGAMRYDTYRILSGHTADALLIHQYHADSVNAVVALAAGGTLNANDDNGVEVSANDGTINLTAGALSGTWTNATVNATGGSLAGRFEGVSTLKGSNGFNLGSAAVQNSGTLTMSGSFDASGMTSTLTNVDMRVDENGAVSRDSSGFLRTGDFEVLVATGTVDSTNAEVTYGGQTLTMTGGTGFGVGEVKYDTYLLQGDDTATVSKIATMAGAALQKIDMQGGTLNVNASTDELLATGGSIQLSAGTLGGSIGGTAAVAVNGTATISGNNSYTGGTALSNGNLTITHANALGTGSISAEGISSLSVGNGVTLVLDKVISNTGTLTLSGSFDASALQLSKTEAGRLTLSGERVGLTESGFSQGVAYSVQLVNGGKSVADGLSIHHDDFLMRTQLVLGEDGVARAGAEVDYTHFFLTGGDAAVVSKIVEVSARNQAELKGVTMDSGTLEVDQSMTVNATGGSIIITKAATLSGTIEDAAVSTAAGDYASEISALLKGDTSLEVNGGTITVSGDNSYSDGTTVNGGTLLAGNAKAFGTGDVTVNDATLDLNQFSIANKVIMNGSSTLGYADGASHIVLGGGAAVNFRDGYTLGRGKVLSVSGGGATYTGSLTLGGGTLELDGLLTVRGNVEFEAGKQTTIDISGWDTAGDGTVLVDFGSANSGYTDDCLTLSGIAGDWELDFDTASGVLTLVAVKDDFRPNLDRNQQEVYDTMKDIMGNGNPGGVLGQLGQDIIGTRDEAALKRALDEISGREYATIMSSQIEGNLGHLRRLRASAGKGTPLGEYVTLGCCYPSNKGVDKSDNKGSSVMIAPSPVIDSRRIHAGVSAFHEQAELDADANGDGFERSESGAQLTMEYLVSNDFVLGMGLSHSRTKLSPTYGKRRDEDNTHVDLYGVYQSGRWSSTTALGVGLHQHELGRTVAGMQTEAEADGLSVNFLQDLAYTVWADEQHGVQVFGSVESSFNMIDAFSESGAGNASLLVDEQEAWATDVTLGMRYNRALPALGKALPGTLTVQAGVVASLGDREHDVSMRFAGAPGYAFKQSAAERSRWGYNVGVSVNLPVTAETALYGSAEAVIRNASTSVDAQLGVKMAF